MADRIAAENEERQKKEAEMADRLKQAQEVREAAKKVPSLVGDH